MLPLILRLSVSPFLTPGILPFAAARPATLFAPLLRRSACAKKGNRKKAHPGGALSGLLPSESAIAFRGLLNVRPCTCSKLARVLRASLRPFLHALAAPQGPRLGGILPQKQGS